MPARHTVGRGAVLYDDRDPEYRLAEDGGSTDCCRECGRDLAAGDERITVVASRAAAQLVEDLRRLRPFASPQGETRQAGMEEVLQA